MDRVQAIVDIIGHGPVNDPAGTTAKGVVGKAGREAGFIDTGELVSCIPRIRGRDPGIRGCRQVAVEVVGLGGCAKGSLLVIRVVGGRREDWRSVTPSKAASSLDAIPGKIVGVG